MITTLHIKNIGIIDDITINLNKGLNVLTGETGAGKSLIIQALNIISGGRFSKEMIGKNDDFSFVEACIYIPKSQFAEDGNVIITREIYSNGRNLCKINGRMVTVSKLKNFMKEILDIHGQNENQTLMEVQNHLEYLDNFCYDKTSILKEKYSKLYLEYNNILNDLEKNYGNDKEKQRTLDLLTYQLNEIDNANLNEREEEDLEEERKKAQNFEKIFENLSISYTNLDNNVLDGLDNIINALSKIESYDYRYKEKYESIQSMYYELNEISHDLYNFKEDTLFDEERLNYIEERLDIISNLKRKYGNNISEILEYRNNINEKIKSIQGLDEYISKRKEDLNIIKKEMYDISTKLDEIRKKGAIDLAQKINYELKNLEMYNANFKVEISFDNSKKYNKNGLNEVKFMISTNLGEDYKPLTKIASGGEISRIMLAIKVVFSNIDKIPIMVFDEIDTGISGSAANKVSDKLKELSISRQVICVTHLAVVAAKADYNYYIEKKIKNEKTSTNIKLLDDNETIKEIARISTGVINEISISHARTLKNQIFNKEIVC